MDWDKPWYGRLLRVVVFITRVLRAARVFPRNLLCAGSCMCMWFFIGRHLSHSVPPLFLTCWWRLVFILLPTPLPVIPSSLGPGPACLSSPIPFVVTFKADHISATLIFPFFVSCLWDFKLIPAFDFERSLETFHGQSYSVSTSLLTPCACWRVLRAAPASKQFSLCTWKFKFVQHKWQNVLIFSWVHSSLIHAGRKE